MDPNYEQHLATNESPMMRADEALSKALKPKPLIFGLTIRNIPTINLRVQYKHDRETVFSNVLDQILTESKTSQTYNDAPFSIAYSEPDAYFTVLFRSTIVGIECALQGAALEELLFSNRLTESMRKLIREPGRLSRSMVDAYYNKIPELVSANAPLKICDHELWETVRQFYREVRNPISHGYELADTRPDSLRDSFRMFDRIYAWIDSWADTKRVHKILASSTFHALR